MTAAPHFQLQSPTDSLCWGKHQPWEGMIQLCSAKSPFQPQGEIRQVLVLNTVGKGEEPDLPPSPTVGTPASLLHAEAGTGEQQNTTWKCKLSIHCSAAGSPPPLCVSKAGHTHTLLPIGKGCAGLGSPMGVQNPSLGAKLPLAQESQAWAVLRAPHTGTKGYLLIYLSLPPSPLL